jgi:hypothetical protein
MKNLWFYSGLLFVLAIFGIGSERIAVPNQEIVIQFSDVDVTLEETQDAIAVVKGQLESIAVANLQLQELGNGTLKITYYSTIDVSQVRELLLNGRTLAQETSIHNENETEFPFEKDGKYYEIGIQTIQDAQDLVGTSEGFLESKSEATRYVTPTSGNILHTIFNNEVIASDAVAYAVYRYVMITVDGSSYKIPEVRAGPLV